jgi:hypothetical protein
MTPLRSDVPCGLEAFLSQWDETVDKLHENMGYSPPQQYQSPAQIRALHVAEMSNSPSTGSRGSLSRGGSVSGGLSEQGAFDARRRKIKEHSVLFNRHVSTVLSLKDQKFFEPEDEVCMYIHMQHTIIDTIIHNHTPSYTIIHHHTPYKH